MNAALPSAPSRAAATVDPAFLRVRCPGRPAWGCSSRDSPATPALPGAAASRQVRRGGARRSAARQQPGGEARRRRGSRGVRRPHRVKPAHARAPGRRAPARESGRPGAGTRRLQPSPGARGWDPAEAGHRGSRREASALREDRAPGRRRGLRAPGLGRRLPSSEISVCPSVPGPTASAAGYRGRRAACFSGCSRLAITRTTASTWSPNSLKSTSSHQPLICIPEVAPRSPAREPLRPPPPGGSPAGRGGRLARRTGRRRGGVGVGGRGGGGGGWRWSLLGKRQSPGCLQIFSSATFRAPLTSAIAALPSLLAPRVRSQSHFLREPGSPDLFRGWLRSLRRPPGSPRLPSSRGVSVWIAGFLSGSRGPCVWIACPFG